MADITINDLPQITSVNPASDFLVVWQTATGQTSKIKINDLLSSNGASGGSVPVTLHGNVGNSPEKAAQASEEVRKSGSFRYSFMQKQNSTISHPGMFATTSSVSGKIDHSLNIFKASGENTINIAGTTITIGGRPVTIQHPTHGLYTSPGSKSFKPVTTARWDIEISADINNLYLNNTWASFTYQMQVFI